MIGINSLDPEVRELSLILVIPITGFVNLSLLLKFSQLIFSFKNG